MQTYIPPCNLEAEQSIIAGMLLDKQAIIEAVQILKVEDFYNEKHQQLFSEILKLSNENQPCDIITLNERGFDIEYLADITSKLPSTANIKYYCNIVKGKSIRRQYIKSAQEVIEMAYNGEFENILDFKCDVQQKMDIEVKDDRQQDASIGNILNNYMLKIDDKCKNKEASYKKYGFKWLDEKMGGVKPSLTYLAARPSVGKSALAINIALNLALQNQSVAIFNLEMEQEQIVQRMISSEGIQSYKLDKPWYLEDRDWEKLNKSIGIIGSRNMYIYDNVFMIEEMRAICRGLKQKGKLDYVVIDYLQLMETMKKLASTNDKVSHISRQLKLMQKEFKVPFLVLSQLSRPPKGSEKENRRPKLTDLRDSGSLEQDADNVLFLHDESYGKYDNNETESSQIELIIGKQRAGERDIMTEIKFYKKTQKFY